MAHKAAEPNQEAIKPLAQRVMEMVTPGIPLPTTLSKDEKRKIALLVEGKIDQLVYAHKGESPEFDGSDFDFNMKADISEHVEGGFKDMPAIAYNPSKQRAALKEARDLALQWRSYLRNSKLLKQISQSSNWNQ